jgi:apolipoprotein N-acyltransferase
MSSQTLAAAGPQAARSALTQRNDGTYPLVSSLASGLALWCAFPPADWGWLAWVALIPLFRMIVRPGSRRALYGGAWAGGLAFWLLAIQWVRLSDPGAWLGWLTMGVTLSLSWPAFLAMGRLAVLRLRLPLMVAAPVLWVALEYVRAYFLTGFPWYYLAHSQHGALSLIQIADFSGALGISFVIALVNATCVDLLEHFRHADAAARRRLTRAVLLRVGLVAVLLATTAGYGVYRLATARFRPGPRLALVQSNLIQRYKMRTEAGKLLEIYQGLVERAAQAVPRPELIVWPETSYPYGFVMMNSGLGPEGFARVAGPLAAHGTYDEWRRKMEAIEQHLHGWTNRLQVPMLVGCLTYDLRGPRLAKYNSAILLEPGKQTVESYHKLHLVPFGEYVPLVESLPWLTALTPYHGPDAVVPSLSFGSAPVWFDLGAYRLAAAICFEDTVPHVARRFFSHPRGGRQPDVLLNLSNDGWFHGSSEHEMHLAVSVFRAIENRVPLARSVNTGVSAFIDGNGRVLDSLPTLEEGILAGTVPLDDRVSLYSTWGDWVGIICLSATLALIPLSIGLTWRKECSSLPGEES